MQQPADADARVEALGAHACVVLFKGEFKEWREMEVAHEAALAAVKPGGGF